MSIIKKFFIGEGAEAEALIAEVRERRETVNNARDAVQKEYGADGLMLNGRGGNAIGLAFKEQQRMPYLKGEVRLEEGFGYYPKLNCKQGKELALKLDAPELQFNANNYILGKLKLHRMCAGPHAASRTGMALYSSAAGYAENKVLVSIPDPKDIDGRHGDPMPDVPTWFREVKESEFLAAQGK